MGRLFEQVFKGPSMFCNAASRPNPLHCPLCRACETGSLGMAFDPLRFSVYPYE